LKCYVQINVATASLVYLYPWPATSLPFLSSEAIKFS